MNEETLQKLRARVGLVTHFDPPDADAIVCMECWLEYIELSKWDPKHKSGIKPVFASDLALVTCQDCIDRSRRIAKGTAQ